MPATATVPAPTSRAAAARRVASALLTLGLLGASALGCGGGDDDDRGDPAIQEPSEPPGAPEDGGTTDPATDPSTGEAGDPGTPTTTTAAPSPQPAAGTGTGSSGTVCETRADGSTICYAD